VGRKKWVRKPEPKRGIAWPRWTGFRGMTLRSWLELLVVPLALVVIGFLFSVQQDARQQRIENQRAQAERELAEQRAQDEALQAYLDQMSQLMLERKLLEAEPDDPVHTLAQARTSTVILRLDAEHNESVTRFLIDSGLAVHSKDSVSLLRRITLSRATLRGAFLPQADLYDADLSGADLSNAMLLNAYLPGSIANNANLGGAVLSGADLTGASLSDADLSDANLSGARRVTNEELAQRAASLEGATMPNGQKYEDWLKAN
jgi:pentapeptide repeat protein